MKVSPTKAGPAFVAVVFAGLAFRLFASTAHYAVNLFFWDQWDFNDATLFQKHSLWDVFRWQHGPHRQGMGGLFAALVEPWFRWNGRTEAFVAAGLVVVAGLCMLLLKYRLFGPLTWVDVAIPILVFAPAQWEAIWLTTNFAHGSMPLLLIVLYCLAWTWRNERAKYAAIVALNFATLYTGFGIFVGLLTPLLFFIGYWREKDRPGFRTYLGVCTLAAVISLASFFVQYHNTPAAGCALLSPPPVEFLRFINLMYASFLGFRTNDLLPTLAGGVVLLAVVAVALAGWKAILGGWQKAGAPYIIVAFLSAYSLLFCVACTLGRTCIGLDDAHSSRYTHYMALGMLGLYFAALLFRAPGWRQFLPAAALLVVLPALIVPPSDTDMKDGFSQLKTNWRDCFKSGRSAKACDEEFGQIYPEPDATRLEQKLEYLRTTRQNLFSDGR